MQKQYNISLHLNTPAYKIASFEITDLQLIKYAASKQKPILISTGMASEEEIDDSEESDEVVDDTEESEENIEDSEEDWDEDESNKRIDIIGQNGNDGLHYDQDDDTPE